MQTETTTHDKVLQAFDHIDIGKTWLESVTQAEFDLTFPRFEFIYRRSTQQKEWFDHKLQTWFIPTPSVDMTELLTFYALSQQTNVSSAALMVYMAQFKNKEKRRIAIENKLPLRQVFPDYPALTVANYRDVETQSIFPFLKAQFGFHIVTGETISERQVLNTEKNAVSIQILRRLIFCWSKPTAERLSMDLYVFEYTIDSLYGGVKYESPV